MLKYHRLLTISQGLPLTPETIESSYVSAVINLWKEQCLEETNPYPSPRGEYLKTFMVNLQISRAQLWRSNYEDRAINNLKDGYTMDEMRKMTDHLMGDMAARSEEKSLRTRLDLQWLHAMMLRSESTRYAEYADLCSKRLENEGPTCLAIILRISQGKTVNRQDAANSRKTMYTGFLRTKEVLLCPVGALAFWLSYRWDVFGEEFPDFSDRASWFATKVVPGKLSAPKTKSLTGHKTRGLRTCSARRASHPAKSCILRGRQWPAWWTCSRCRQSRLVPLSDIHFKTHLTLAIRYREPEAGRREQWQRHIWAACLGSSCGVSPTSAQVLDVTISNAPLSHLPSRFCDKSGLRSTLLRLSTRPTGSAGPILTGNNSWGLSKTSSFHHINLQ